jgi:ADP-dependent NAD(P)H-hydrate dehydratase / NAD(P)H-hydrate epimerase
MNPFSELPPVLSAAQMREADRITKDEIGISGFTLMESAGREIAEVAQEMIELGLEARSTQTLEAEVICLCGKGNNGGDGFVAARYLSANGHRVRVVLMAPPGVITP